jgi:hypothetical protein
MPQHSIVAAPTPADSAMLRRLHTLGPRPARPPRASSNTIAMAHLFRPGRITQQRSPATADFLLAHYR